MLKEYISSTIEKSEDGCNIFESMKSLNIKDAIYTIADSCEEWNLTLRKSWRKFWLEVITESDLMKDEQNNDSQKIIKDLQSIEPNVLAREFEEWIDLCDKDCRTSKELNEDHIIAAFLENIDDKETMNENTDSDADESFTRTSHTDAKNVFDIALQYIERNLASTPIDIF